MPTVLHKTLPDSELHEPKGVANAVRLTVYRANGVGSGNWVKITPDMLQGINTNGVQDQPVVADGNGNFVLGATSVNGYGRANKATVGGSTSMWTLTANATNVTPVSENVALTSTGIRVYRPGLFKVSLNFDAVADTQDGQSVFNHRVYKNNDVVIGEVKITGNTTGGSLDALVRLNANDEIRIGPWNVPSNRTSTAFYYSVSRVSL